MYVSWNDFNVARRSLVTFSSDNGATWHSPVMVSNQPTFIRNVQITGDMAGGGALYIAGMDEGGGGFPHDDTNLIFKSTDGGDTWSNTYTGPTFPDLALRLPVTLPACFPIWVPTGGTKAGVNLLRLATSFTWSMRSTALAAILATSSTFAPPTVVSPLARRSC